MKMIRTMIRIVIIILKALPVSHTWCRAHICHEYHELRSWRKNMPCGEISALYTEFEQFMEFYRSLCCFCSISMWRKICAEKICVKKKMTYMRAVYRWNVFIFSPFSALFLLCRKYLITRVCVLEHKTFDGIIAN